MPFSAWKKVFWRAIKETSDDNVGLVAAGVAFYGFLAMVPLLGALVLSYGLVAEPATVVENMQTLMRIMPADAANLIGEQLLNVIATSDGKKGLGLLLALALALFGARNGAGAIITALNIAYEEKEKRGFFRINLLALKFQYLFSAGVTISLEGVLFAAIGSLLTALAASLLPAISAMRASPLDAMTQLAVPSKFSTILFSAFGGILLGAVDPFIVFGPLSRDASFYGHFLVGLPAAMLGFFFLAPLLRADVEPFLGRTLGFLPLFQGAPYGVGMLAASLILGIMVTPTVTAICREVFRAVPGTQREAALGLGATKWEMIRLAVVKSSWSGVFGAGILGLGRALGETMAVTMLIGNRNEISASLFAPGQTMASVIANEYAEAGSNIHLAALAYVGLALFVVSFVVNLFARRIVRRLQTPGGSK